MALAPNAPAFSDLDLSRADADAAEPLSLRAAAAVIVAANLCLWSLIALGIRALTLL